MLGGFRSKYKPGKGTFIHECTEQASVNHSFTFSLVGIFISLCNPGTSYKE